MQNTSTNSLKLYTSFLLFILLGSLCLSAQDRPAKIWVGTWGTAPQLVEPGNNPPSPGLTNNSLRQIVRVSIPGDTIRVKFSNIFSETSVTLNAVKIAVSAGGSAVYDSTSKLLTFGGVPEVTMGPGTDVLSDPLAFNLEPRMTLAVTIYFGQTSATITGHPGSRTTSYLKAGNDTSVANFAGAVTTDHWYIITNIDVLATHEYSCISVIGNSITDGRGSVTNLQNRWTDVLSERLLENPGTEKVGVLNMGLGGNCVLKACLGPAAKERYKRDVLEQPGIQAAIVFEGVNDIGGINTPELATETANRLIEAYKAMIDSAHARNIFIYGATITPFKGNGYYTLFSEACRNKVNEWIRNSGRFDAVLDFDMAVRKPSDTASLISSYQNDGLHPDTAGYRLIVNSIDLSLFEGLNTRNPEIDTSVHVNLWIEPESQAVGKNRNQLCCKISSRYRKYYHYPY